MSKVRRDGDIRDQSQGRACAQRRFWGCLTVACCLAAGVANLHASEALQPGPGFFFVATNGNDSWSGSLPAPNARQTDGPFATVARGLQAVREFKKQRYKPGGALSLFVRQGTYFLEQPLVLGPDDSNLLLSAYPGERAILSGGRPISGWQPVTVNNKKLWAVTLPEVRDGNWFFRELWVDGRRATRARYPNHGFLRVAEVPDKTPRWGEGNKRFRFRAGELPRLENTSNVEAVVITRYIQSRLKLAQFAATEHTLTFTKRTSRQITAGDPYYLEGALEFLDEPGEWDLDRASGKLYYLPRPGEKPDQIHAIAPRLTQLLILAGRPEQDQFIQRLTVRSLWFSNSEWYFPPGYLDPTNEPSVWQLPTAEVAGMGTGALGVPSAVAGKGLHDCIFDQCVFIHLGNYALELTKGCQRNHVVACLMTDLGCGGIKIGEPVYRPKPQEQTGGNEVRGCHISEGGKFFHDPVGIFVGQSAGNHLHHNLIHDFYESGISVGFTWGYSFTLARDNVIEFNLVHHIGKLSNGDGPICSDMAGIYTLGRQPGTVIRNNIVHDVTALTYGGFGIYLDEGSSGVLVESNLVYRTTQGGFHLHFGETNLVRNNIFAFGRDAQVQRTKTEPHLTLTFEHNIVYFDTGMLFGNNWNDDNFVVDWNLYYDTRAAGHPESLVLGPCSWERWHARGHDLHSIIADPLFVDPKKDDFRLKPDSPAFKIGFHPIDFSKIGL